MNKVHQIAQRHRVQEALARFRGQLDEVVNLMVAIQQIPAPTFDESQRAQFVERQFREQGLHDVQQDELHNVYGRLPGRSPNALPVVVSAHSDTVFGPETDLTVSRNGQRIYGPGIADNSLGVAALLLLAETLQTCELRPQRPVWFVANVGEEGLGDLNGMRAVVDRFGKTAAYLVLEGGLYGYVCHQAIGVRRYRIDVQAPGGHSWGAFGAPSAIHVLGRLIAAVDRIELSKDPKSTYNVGLVEGGTAINAIAQSARMLLDLRSEDPEALDALVHEVETLVTSAGEEPDVTVTMNLIGSRPAGRLSKEAPLARWAVAALEAVGCGEIEFTAGSTDANIPLSRHFPAICVGLSRSGNTHRPDEYVEVEPIPSGLGQALLLLLAAADL